MSLREQLTERVARAGGEPESRCLAWLHGAACVGRFGAVAELLAIARERKVARARLREAALQVVAYGGFPRALQTLTLLADGAAPQVGAPLADAGQHDRVRAGRRVWEAVYARHADEVAAGLERLAPGLHGWVVEDAYGRVLSRPGLSLGERELLAVAALALMALPAPLGGHVRGALRNGCETRAVLDILDGCRLLADPAALQTIDQTVERLSRNVYRP